MKKIINVILAIFVVGTFTFYKYQTDTSKIKKSVLVEKNINVESCIKSKNIEDLSNSIKLSNSSALTYLNIKNSTKNKITVNGKNSVGTLRSYILSWYNDGNQMNGCNVNVKCVIPNTIDEKKLLLFMLNKCQKEYFRNKYGTNNIMISVDGLGVAAASNKVVKPEITVNGIAAYGFSIFNVGTTVSGSKRFDYGFVTSDGVVISASELSTFADVGKVLVISTGQEIDFNGADNGQNSCLV